MQKYLQYFSAAVITCRQCLALRRGEKRGAGVIYHGGEAEEAWSGTRQRHSLCCTFSTVCHHGDTHWQTRTHPWSLNQPPLIGEIAFEGRVGMKMAKNKVGKWRFSSRKWRDVFLLQKDIQLHLGEMWKVLFPHPCRPSRLIDNDWRCGWPDRLSTSKHVCLKKDLVGCCTSKVIVHLI